MTGHKTEAGLDPYESVDEKQQVNIKLEYLNGMANCIFGTRNVFQSNDPR